MCMLFGGKTTSTDELTQLSRPSSFYVFFFFLTTNPVSFTLSLSLCLCRSLVFSFYVLYVSSVSPKVRTYSRVERVYRDPDLQTALSIVTTDCTLCELEASILSFIFFYLRHSCVHFYKLHCFYSYVLSYKNVFISEKLFAPVSLARWLFFGRGLEVSPPNFNPLYIEGILFPHGKVEMRAQDESRWNGWEPNSSNAGEKGTCKWNVPVEYRVTSADASGHVSPSVCPRCLFSHISKSPGSLCPNQS